jgi:hypothetical protein
MSGAPCTSVVNFMLEDDGSLMFPQLINFDQSDFFIGFASPFFRWMDDPIARLLMQPGQLRAI